MYDNYEQITAINYQQVIKKIDYFITNLSSNHTLSGSDYQKLIDIGQWARDHKHLTKEQKWYVINTIEENQEQLDPFKIY